MAVQLFRLIEPFRNPALDFWLFVIAYGFIVLSLIPGIGSALISLISLILGHETSTVDYLREWSLLLYPLVATISLCLSWIERINQDHMKSWLILSMPFAFMVVMLCLDCHPFISLFILPTIPKK